VGSGYGGKQLKGNDVLGSGVPVMTGLQYLSGRAKYPSLSKSQLNPPSYIFPVSGHHLKKSVKEGAGLLVSVKVSVGMVHCNLLVCWSRVPVVGPGTQDPSGQVQESLQVAVGLNV
jgi:hypothetical protein